MLGDADFIVGRRLVVLETLGQLFGVVEDVLHGTRHRGHLKNFWRELIAESVPLHREELVPNWELARDSQPIHPAVPCRNMTFVTRTYLPVIAGSAVIRDHVLRLLFSDGTVGDVDFSAEEWRGVLEPLGHPKYLARARVDPEARTVT